MTTPHRRTRGLSAALLALAVTAALGPLATSPASAATADRPRLTFGPVSASPEATPDGTAVTTRFTVENRSDRRRPARSAYVSLVAVDRDPGPQQAYRIDAVRVPAQAAGDTHSVLSETTAPRAVVDGRHHVRVCSTRVAADGSCRLSPRPAVQIGEASVALDSDDIDAGDVEPGSVTPVDVVVHNTGQSRTNAIGLAVRGGDHPEDFSVEIGTCTTWLAAGESCTAQVVFAPAEDVTGIRNSVLAVGGRKRGGVVAASLVGTVVPRAVLTIEPGEFSYGSVAAGSSLSQTFELVNSSDTDEPLTAGNLADYTGFIFDYADGQNSCLSGVIPANGSCTFSVAFVPPTGGEFSTVATFGGPRGDATALLSGTGTGTEPVRASARRAPRAGDYLR